MKAKKFQVNIPFRSGTLLLIYTTERRTVQVVSLAYEIIATTDHADKFVINTWSRQRYQSLAGYGHNDVNRPQNLDMISISFKQLKFE